MECDVGLSLGVGKVTHFDALEHDDWLVLGLLSIVGVGM